MCDIQITYATLKQHQLRRKEKTETMMRYVPLYAAHNAYVWVNRYCFTWLLSMTAGMFQLPYYICTVSQPPRINTTLIQSLFFFDIKRHTLSSSPVLYVLFSLRLCYICFDFFKSLFIWRSQT